MIALPGELTQSQADACLAALAAQMRGEAGPLVCVDASGLARFDSSALAVLLECRRLALAAGRQFAVHGMPQRLGQLAGLYGVAQLMPGPVSPPAGPSPAA